MPTKKVTRKIISKSAAVDEDFSVKSQERTTSADTEQVSHTKSKKVCVFCQTKTSPSYTDTIALRKFLTDRGRILAKLRSGLCSKHQRRVTKQIKYSRHLALLPFIPKV